MLHLYHSPAVFAARGRALTALALMQDGEELFPQLELVADVGEDIFTLRMLPEDGIMTDESFTLFSVQIPAEKLRGERLIYHFTSGGKESVRYTVPLLNLPELPPLIITETFLWAGACAYFEIYNTTDRTLALSDFALFMDRPGVGKFRNPMRPAGDDRLPPHTAAILRFLTPAVKNDKSYQPGKDAFFAGLEKLSPSTCGEQDLRNVLYFECDLTAQNPETGAYVLQNGCFEPFQRSHAVTYFLTPANGGEAEAFYRLSINVDLPYHDIFCRRAALWYPDLQNPSKAVLYEAFRAPTPGYPDPAGGYPDAADSVPPALMPVSPCHEATYGGGELQVSFAALGERTEYPRLWLKNADGAYEEYHPTPDHNGYFTVTLPAAVAEPPETLEYYAEMTGGCYTARMGSAEHPVTVRLFDRAGPRVLSLTPADGQVLEKELLPTICARFSDRSGVNLSLSILCLDGRNVTAEADWTGDGVRFVPRKPLAFGKHTIELTLRDMLGNRTYRKALFAIGKGAKLHCFIGQVHCHTGDSDGVGTPEEAIRFAREQGRVDFFAVTDHSHLVTPDRYAAQIVLSERCNRPGSFASIHGFEMTWNNKNGYWGHMNVLGSDLYERMIDDVDLPKFYEELKKHPESVAMFNHPGDTWGNFNDYAWHDPEIDRIVCLAELCGGSYDRQYALMLSKGWHVAPVFNEDNHKADWTRATNGCGVVLAPALSRENILDAMRRRRAYSTDDRSTEVYYKVNGEWLGSTLNAPEKLTVSVEAHTGNEQGLGLLQLVSEDNIVVAHISVGARRDFVWQVELDPDFDYYYIRITNGKNYTVTAPVFVTGRDLLNITAFDCGIAKDERDFYGATLTFCNTAARQMSDVRVDFYLSPADGFELRTLAPYATVDIGRLAAGEKRTVTYGFPDVPGNRRLSAVVSGSVGKKRYADTAYLLLTPAMISKILPLTEKTEKDGKEIANPFAYAEICNFTPRKLAISGLSLKLWETLGKPPLPAHVLNLQGGYIPPFSTLTVWQRPKDSGLVAADFNARYGTSLIEGEDLLITETAVLDTEPFGRRLDLTAGNELLSRAPFGCYCTKENDIVKDVPILYARNPGMTVSMRKLPAGEEPPAPGKTLAAQLPPAVACPVHGENAEQEPSGKKKPWVTRLLHAPLIPLEAAQLVAGALAAVKDLLWEKK